MKSYKTFYLKQFCNIKVTSYNYDKPITIFKYIVYLRKTLHKLFKYGRNQIYIDSIIDKLLNISSEIQYIEDEALDLITAPLWEIKQRLLIYQQRIL